MGSPVWSSEKATGTYGSLYEPPSEHLQCSRLGARLADPWGHNGCIFLFIELLRRTFQGNKNTQNPGNWQFMRGRIPFGVS
jgi:hypothetical protein